MKQLRGDVAALGAMLALALTATPARAQETPPAEAPVEVVGPPQLRDFSLNGTVTRRATEQPVAPEPVRRPPSAAPRQTTDPTAASPAPRETADRTAANRQATAAQARRDRPAPHLEMKATLALLSEAVGDPS